MYLRRQHVDGLAHALTRAITEAKELHLKESPARLEARIRAIIETDQATERALEDEADRILQRQLRLAGGGADIDHAKARLLIKKELAKKRGLIL